MRLWTCCSESKILKVKEKINQAPAPAPAPAQAPVPYELSCTQSAPMLSNNEKITILVNKTLCSIGGPGLNELIDAFQKYPTDKILIGFDTYTSGKMKKMFIDAPDDKKRAIMKELFVDFKEEDFKNINYYVSQGTSDYDNYPYIFFYRENKLNLLIEKLEENGLNYNRNQILELPAVWDDNNENGQYDLKLLLFGSIVTNDDKWRRYEGEKVLYGENNREIANLNLFFAWINYLQASKKEEASSDINTLFAKFNRTI